GQRLPHCSRRRRRLGRPHPRPDGGRQLRVLGCVDGLWNSLGMSAGPEIWFYHLERSTLDQVLPGLLEKTRARGWRALVRAADRARLDDIDDHLWTWRDDSFLAHGLASAADAARQPILLTESSENANAAQALFILDDVELGDTEGYARCFIIFDGRDEASL